MHHNAGNRELHQAEKLATEENKNAFKFDTITPKNKVEADTENSGEEKEVKTLESSSDDCGGFASVPSAPKFSRVKRGTVVGNPMFANTPDSETGPGESLGLDDLDMDYEQIMTYFDNLKVNFYEI